jgi:hypothetical protein
MLMGSTEVVTDTRCEKQFALSPGTRLLLCKPFGEQKDPQRMMDYADGKHRAYVAKYGYTEFGLRNVGL